MTFSGRVEDGHGAAMHERRDATAAELFAGPGEVRPGVDGRRPPGRVRAFRAVARGTLPAGAGYAWR